MKRLKKRLFLFFVCINFVGFAQQKKDTLRVHFVGNSYTYKSNIPHLVSLISDHTNTKLITSKSVAGGAWLFQHYKGERNLQTLDKIKSGGYDIVVLQDHSMGAIARPDSLLLYAGKFSKYIKEYGAEPYFYATWTKEKVPQYHDTIRKVYTQAAKENDAGIVYVGDVWEKAKTLRPNIELYEDDGSHQSDLGAFLTACKFVKELTGELPNDLPEYYDWKDENGEWISLIELDRFDVVFCVKVVNE
ncbi:hypothetical protein GZ212_11385 [Mangrovimonas sp. CR14]|uniref:hypothetical protein n=1 Tax=Mangrovimonas sp. CR14 TaxID=2706120 RepID=UPI001420530E|nr:hypothetical protein [Mangrovimonas sp. CR14]NIK92755.1 hypothetical protein [Mangrovimonas sp. CR14]